MPHWQPETPEASSNDWMGTSRPHDPEYDAIAELFLGEDDMQPAHEPALRLRRDDDPSPPDARLAEPEGPASDDEEQPAQPSPSPAHAAERDATHARRTSLVLDAVILGHLPVYAGAWVTQYARRLAEEEAATVALVRMLSGEATVELVCARQSEMREPPRQPSSFEEALRLAARASSRVVLRTDETNEPELVQSPAIDEVTVLVSANDPAIVAAYRTIKSLAGCWAESSHKPALRASAMGVSSQEGARATAKLSRAVSTFLDLPLIAAPAAETIEPVRSIPLFRGDARISVSQTLAALTEPQQDADHAAPAPSPGPCSTPAAAAPPALDVVTERNAPSVAPAANNAEALREESESLTHRIAGLVRLGVDIPRCEGVEIAADAEGTLHLLCRDLAGLGVRRLVAAAAWTDLNKQVLAMASRPVIQRDLRTDRAPTLHLFTDRAPDVRDLLDADLRVHLLVPVRIEDAHWACADLN